LGIASAQDPSDDRAPDVEAALAELDQAGSPATAAEIAEFSRAATSVSSYGGLLGRTGWSAAGPDYSLRLDLASRGLTVKGRWRQDRSGAQFAAGAVGIGPQGARVTAGQLGIAHGFGLLAAGPGRGPTLTADGTLARSGRGLRSWTGRAAPQTVRGVSGQLSWGAWRGEALHGRRDGTLNGDRPTTLIRLGVADASWRAAALLVVDPRETGASLALRGRRGPLETAGEFSVRRPVGARRFLAAWLTQGGWRLHRDFRLEILAGWADPGPRPVMAQKHPVFGDWAGQGVAVRVVWRAGPGVRAKLLLHRGQGAWPEGPGPARRRSLVDALLSRTWDSGCEGAIRWRAGNEAVTAWSERFPWLPPTPAWRDTRRVLSVVAGWRAVGGRGQVRWRRLQLERNRQGIGQESGGGRSLLTVAGRRRLAGSVQVRAAWTTSWGDPVDLVSAVAPVAGYVLPRHWGHWRSEHLIGLAWDPGSWRGEFAVSRRQPDRLGSPAPESDVWTVWGQGSWNW
jgi:hypothetical protein